MTEYTIYGRPDCTYCEQAKKLLDTQGLPYNYLDASNSLFFQRNFKDKGVNKVPQIFLSETAGERYIGGYEELLREVL